MKGNGKFQPLLVDVMNVTFFLKRSSDPIMSFQKGIIIDRKAREIMYLVASVCPPVTTLTAESFDLRP